MDAPNRVPDFVKPEGRVWLGWDAGVLERFPAGTNRVGDPPVDLHWVVVEPADYGCRIEASSVTNRRQVVASFRMNLHLPPEGLPATKPARGTVFLLHGYGVDLETLFPWAVYLAEAGWRSVLVDLPGHGHSGGRKVSFGVHEVGALKALRSCLENEHRWGGPYVVVGHSMGAALALRWQAEDDAIVGSVAFGPYAEFVPVALRLRDDYARWMPRGWVRRAAQKIPGILGVEPSRLDTRPQISGRHVLALLIASREDVITPPEDSEALRGELADGSDLLVVGGASHETLPYVFPLHGERVRRWLEDVTASGHTERHRDSLGGG